VPEIIDSPDWPTSAVPHHLTAARTAPKSSTRPSDPGVPRMSSPRSRRSADAAGIGIPVQNLPSEVVVTLSDREGPLADGFHPKGGHSGIAARRVRRGFESRWAACPGLVKHTDAGSQRMGMATDEVGRVACRGVIWPAWL